MLGDVFANAMRAMQICKESLEASGLSLVSDEPHLQGASSRVEENKRLLKIEHNEGFPMVCQGCDDEAVLA